MRFSSSSDASNILHYAKPERDSAPTQLPTEAYSQVFTRSRPFIGATEPSPPIATTGVMITVRQFQQIL